MRGVSWRPTALLLVALVVASARAATPPPDAATLRREIRVVLAFRQLGLTQTQAQALVTAAAEARAAQAAIAQAQRTFWEQTRETIVAIEWAMIRNQPVEQRQQDSIDRQRSRYRRATDDADSALRRALSRIEETLTPAQRALLEPPEAEAQRLAAEQQARRQLDEAYRQATVDMTLWIPNAQGESIAEEMATRINNVLNLAYPGASPDSLAERRTKLQGLYTQVRAMSGGDLDQFRDEIGPQLRAALPPSSLVATGPRYVLSRKEWNDLWRGDLGYRLLLAMRPSLPAGETR